MLCRPVKKKRASHCDPAHLSVVPCFSLCGWFCSRWRGQMNTEPKRCHQGQVPPVAGGHTQASIPSVGGGGVPNELHKLPKWTRTLAHMHRRSHLSSACAATVADHGCRPQRDWNAPYCCKGHLATIEVQGQLAPQYLHADLCRSISAASCWVPCWALLTSWESGRLCSSSINEAFPRITIMAIT